MKAVILSAGSGSRLLPLTRHIPKCLVTLGGRAILDLQLDALAQAGVREAFVVGGYRIDQVAQHLKDTPPPLTVELRYNPFWAVASSIGSVWTARELLDRPFCLMNGDTVFDASVVADALGRAQCIGLLVEPIIAHEHDDMLVRVANGAVAAVAKTLDPVSATHRSLGLIVAADPGHAYADALLAVIRGEDGTAAFHHAVVDRLARRGRVEAIERAPGCWREVDQPKDIAGWEADNAAR